ncbi:hypothetical protein WM29_22750 [Burkholderia ubonensis]|uniref:hypothetical protein n=1 Tax=Burkholderia ubonensis TaxID=101571 RepID=UPI000841E685|nr:hypothetical protein [Burkholderia ubonensis]AOK61955.1 hypothetical protein WM29_22750 [Burkholderia ubonensis]
MPNDNALTVGERQVISRAADEARHSGQYKLAEELDDILAARPAEQAGAGHPELTDSDVFTLIGHAELLHGRGETDMPAWCMGLARRIAVGIDESLALRVEALATRHEQPVAHPGQTKPRGEASPGVIAAALSLIEADRAQALTNEYVDALDNAIRIQRGELKLPEGRTKLPSFPAVFCKMWSGREIQSWINENIAPHDAALRDALDHIARVARGSREQSRRQRWIELRALGALTGTDEWRTLPLPKNGDGVRRRLVHRISELDAEVERLNAIIAARPDQPEPRAEVTDWQPIATAPADQLVTVFWLDSEDEKNPERYDFDYIEEGGWVKWNDHYDWAHSVAPAGSRMPREQAPYTHWKPLGSPTPAVDATRAGDSHAA